MTIYISSFQQVTFNHSPPSFSKCPHKSQSYDVNHLVSVVLTLRPKWKSDSEFCVYSIHENCQLLLFLLPIVVVCDAIVQRTCFRLKGRHQLSR